MATLLPNWPIAVVNADFQHGPPNTPGANSVSLNTPALRLTLRGFTTQRGRQYELDQVQAGTATLDIHDPTEQLNPFNSGSLFNVLGNTLIPYRCVQIGAWWNPTTQSMAGNLLNSSNRPPGFTSTYDPSFESATVGWIAFVAGSPSAGQSTAQHFDGAKSLQVVVNTAADSIGWFVGTAPGITYTFSAYVFVPSGATARLTLQDWPSAVTLTTATSSTAGAWQRLTMTGTPSGAAVLVSVTSPSGTRPTTFYVDAVQAEVGSSATAFTTTGPIYYPIYTGYIERYPMQWDMGGTRGLRPLECVDALAILSRTAINQSYDATIQADSPIIYLPWSNSTPATTSNIIASGDTGSNVVQYPMRGDPTYIVSPSGSINWGGDQQPDGTPAISVTQQNALNPPANGGPNQDTYIDILNAYLSFDFVGGGMIEFWAKPVSGEMSIGGIYAAAPGLSTNFATSVPLLNLESSGFGNLLFNYNPDSTTTNEDFFDPPQQLLYPDNQWHYFAITVTSGNWKQTMDNTDSNNASVVTPGRIGFTYISHISANTGYGDPQSQVSFGRWAYYSRDIGQTRRLAHYLRGAGYINEKPGARVTRLLGQYWTGSVSISSGFLAMAPDFNYDPTGQGSQARFVLDVLQEIQDSERGLIYTRNDGILRFEDRVSRYTAQTALWVFGENPVGASPAEYTYQDYQADFDPTYTFSQANLTRPDNTNFAPIVNTATQTKYGQRILTQELQCNTDFDLTQAGIFYTHRYQDPKLRVSKLTLKPSANPALWGVILSLEISQRVTVTRRSAGVTITGDFYVEQINHQVNAVNGDWTVDLQLSPVFVPTAWVLGDSTYGVLGSTTVPVY